MQMVKLERGGEAVKLGEAQRRHRRAARPHRRGRPRRRPPHLPPAVDRQPARRSTSTWSPRSRTRTRSSTCSTPTPASTRSGARPPRPASSGARSTRRRPRRCSCTSASSTCCAALSELPEVLGAGLHRPGPAQGHHLGARAGRPVPRLLPRLLRHRGRAARAHPGPAVAGRGRPHRLAIGLDLLGVSAPESM